MHRSYFIGGDNSVNNNFKRIEGEMMKLFGEDFEGDDSAILSRNPVDSFYQSDEMSSEQENSQTRSQKKFYPSNNGNS